MRRSIRTRIEIRIYECRWGVKTRKAGGDASASMNRNRRFDIAGETAGADIVTACYDKAKKGAPRAARGHT